MLLITDTGMYVNHNMSCLKEYEESLNVVKLEPTTNDIKSNIKMVDASYDKAFMDLSKTGYDSWQYQCINNHAREIIDLFAIKTDEYTVYRDVIILGDLNIDALYVMDVLQKSEYNADIHLILPLPFERTVKGTIQHELLNNLNKVKTLAIYDPYKLSIEKYGNIETENVEKIINEQTEYLLKRFFKLARKMQYQSPSTKYFFDFDKDSYVDTDSLYVLDDYMITKTLGLLCDPYNLYQDKEENDYLISCMHTPVPRPDGKQICEKLRSIRKEFAKLNGIEYKFKECTYNGPCGGTCQACDNEAMELSKLAKKMGNIKYPKVSLEE